MVLPRGERRRWSRRTRGLLRGLPAAILIVVGLSFSSIAAGPVVAAPTGVSLDVGLTLREDGSLMVKSTIRAPQGYRVSQRLPLSVPVEGSRTQHFTLSEVRAENGSASVSDDALQVSAPGGTTTVSYVVRGTVADGPELQQFTWPIAAGYATDIDTVTMRFASPSPAPDSPLCGIGQVGERRLCTLTQTDAGGVVTAEQKGLAAGKVAVFTTLLPAGTVPADARFTGDTAANSSSSSRPSLGGLIALAAASVLAAALVGFGFLRRRADTAAAQSSGPTAELVTSGPEGPVFASPDGVLPGQIGTLLDGRFRSSDFGATVLDLAVRGYLWFAALPDGEFQVSRRAPLDGAVTASERATVESILPGGTQTTTLTELASGPRPLALDEVRDATREETVQRKWLRPGVGDQSRWVLLGFAVALVGAVAAVALAFVGHGWAYAVAVLVAGLGVLAMGLLLPQRTVGGSRLAAGVGGLRQYLIATNLSALPPAERNVLFNRAVPFAHALGELRGWIGTWSTPNDQLDWFRGPANRVGALAAMLDGVATQESAARRR